MYISCRYPSKRTVKPLFCLRNGDNHSSISDDASVKTRGLMACVEYKNATMHCEKTLMIVPQRHKYAWAQFMIKYSLESIETINGENNYKFALCCIAKSICQHTDEWRQIPEHNLAFQKFGLKHWYAI